jgi:hypothetical protein
VTYPPKGQLPLPAGTNGTFSTTSACRVWSMIENQIGLYVLLINKTFRYVLIVFDLKP